jgi:ATP11 protein
MSLRYAISVFCKAARPSNSVLKRATFAHKPASCTLRSVVGWNRLKSRTLVTFTQKSPQMVSSPLRPPVQNFSVLSSRYSKLMPCRHLSVAGPDGPAPPKAPPVPGSPASKWIPPSSGFTNPAPKELKDVVKLTLLEREPPERIKEIWKEHHDNQAACVSTTLNVHEFNDTVGYV